MFIAIHSLIYFVLYHARQKEGACCDYLDPGLCEAEPHGELLPHEDVRVVSLPETPLQLVQLARTEPERHHIVNRPERQME